MRPNLIYDVGAHEGEDSEFYLRKGFEVVAIEALPSLCDRIEQRLKHFVTSGQLKILNFAISEQSGAVTFYQNLRNTVWGTAEASWAKRNERFGAKSKEIIVPGIRFAELLKTHGVPYYLKVDIEGRDLLCVQALAEIAAKPKFVSLESEKVSWKALIEEFELFESLGYREFKAIAQHKVDAQRCPSPAKEGKFVSHDFVGGASGLFGNELPGDWLDRAKIEDAYKKIFLKYRLFGDETILGKNRLLRALAKHVFRFEVGWYDTHASLSRLQ